MKNNNIFFIILFCTISMLMLSACEKSELQQSSPISSNEIKDRTCPIDDCVDCDPVEDCCCSVELLSAVSTTLKFCGTSGPCLSTTTCFTGGLTFYPDISGFEEVISLSPSQRALFCVPKNAPFGITSATGTPQIRITCQLGQTSPQFVTMTLNTPPDKPYWSTGSDCFLTSCF